jgi:hypothetical protein
LPPGRRRAGSDDHFDLVLKQEIQSKNAGTWAGVLIWEFGFG